MQLTYIREQRWKNLCRRSPVQGLPKDHFQQSRFRTEPGGGNTRPKGIPKPQTVRERDQTPATEVSEASATLTGPRSSTIFNSAS